MRKCILMLPVREATHLLVSPTADCTEITASYSPLGREAIALPDFGSHMMDCDFLHRWLLNSLYFQPILQLL